MNTPSVYSMLCGGGEERTLPPIVVERLEGERSSRLWSWVQLGPSTRVGHRGKGFNVSLKTKTYRTFDIARESDILEAVLSSEPLYDMRLKHTERQDAIKTYLVLSGFRTRLAESAVS